MNKLIDRDETIVYNGVKYDFTLYWGKDARNGGLFGTPPSSVGITKWLDSNQTNYKIIHISVDTGRTDVFWVYERVGLFGKTLWKKRIDENINTIPFDKILEQIPSYAQ